MDSSRLTRRQLLKGAGVGVGAAVVGTTLPPASVDAEEDVPQLLGEIVEVVAPARTILLSRIGTDSQGPTVVKFTDNAEFWRDGEEPLDAFQRDDAVAIEGEWVGPLFQGTAMKPIFVSIDDLVDRIEGARLFVEGFVITLGAHTVAEDGNGYSAKPLSQIRGGDHIVAQARRDPESGELVAFTIGVRGAH